MNLYNLNTCTHIIILKLQNYCQSLERSLADLRQQFRDQTAEFNAVKIELARFKYYRDENQHLADHLQKQQTDVEEVTKVGPLFISVHVQDSYPHTSTSV